MQPAQSKEEEGSINKKRQELSDQLRQISQKIDKEIIELRKQNNIGNNLTDSVRKRERESFGPNTTTTTTPIPATRSKEVSISIPTTSITNSRDTISHK